MKAKLGILLMCLWGLICPLFGQTRGNYTQKKVAILEVANIDGDLKNGDLLMILGTLTTAVTNMPEYKGYERTDIARILGEQDFQRTGMVNDTQIKRIGEMESCSYVLASAAARMTNGKLAITAKFLDVETAEVSQNATVQTTMTDLEKGCLELVRKLFGQGGTGYGERVSGSNYTETAFGINMQMVWVEGGSFLMGCTSEQGSDCEENENPVRRVSLDGYYIGKFEVTQGQWEKVMGLSIYQQKNRQEEEGLFGVGADYPMYYVSWEEATAFCEELSRRTGKKYRLPTEAQWEYAARDGNRNGGTKYSGSSSLDAVAWYAGNSGYTAHPVGMKRSNLLGIHDMSGNVWEWCRDWYSSTYNSLDTQNPKGPSRGTERVLRGGSSGYLELEALVRALFKVKGIEPTEKDIKDILEELKEEDWTNDDIELISMFYRVSCRTALEPEDEGCFLGFRVVCEP